MSDFFPPRSEAEPKIYAYTDSNPEFAGLLKIGQTSRDTRKRMKEHYPTKGPKQVWTIILEESAVRNDGSVFTDHDVHRYLREKKFKNLKDTEWFKCTEKDVRAAILAVRRCEINEENRSLDFLMRPEQKAAVEMTANYFVKAKKENSKKLPTSYGTPRCVLGKLLPPIN